MNFGFNSNVRVGSAIYHVQTEDRGPSHPFLDTVVYEAGRVVHKRSISYEDLAAGVADREVSPEELHERLAQQHRDVIAQLETGALILNTAASATAHTLAETSRESLEIRLLNPNSWLALGSVTLQVELKRRGATQQNAGADVEVFLDHEKDRSVQFRTRADAKGRATLKFPLPETVANGTVLVIRAADGDVYGQLRFRLKTRRLEQAPAPSEK